MRDDYLVFGSPLIEEAEINEVVDSLRAGWLGTGPKVHKFENDFKAYKQSPFAVAVNSCTTAMHLSMIAAGIGEGDEVITSAMTFCATVNAIIHTGAKPVLVDCDISNQCIIPQSIREKINSRTKAIIPVHFAGNACDMSAIMDIAEEYQLKVIEDCAHAIETTYQGKRVGTFGDYGCFSFYATKNIVTGEGGMVITRHKEDNDKIRIIALHGMTADAWKRFSDEGYRHYQVIYPGYKSNMMDIQAALGIHQLKRVDRNLQRREKIWQKYNESFAGLNISLPPDPAPEVKHAYHLYTILIDKDKAGVSRDEFLSVMHRENIGTGVHYLSIPEHPFYQTTFGWKPEDYPNAMKIGRETVSLPLSAKLTDSDVDSVILTVKKILS